MRDKDGNRLHRLPDRHDTGYAGFGYGGDHLYVVCLVDVFDPPRYLVRADSWGSAYETAEECLVDTIREGELAAYGIEGGWEGLERYVAEKGNLPDGLTYSASGRLIDAEADIRCEECPKPAGVAR